MHCGLFPIHHFVHISSITHNSWGVCNSTTQQMTPLLPRMLHFMLKAAKPLQPTSYDPYIHCCLVILCASMYNNKTQGAYDCTVTHETTTLLPRMHLVRRRKQGTTYELSFSTSIYTYGVFANYTTRRLY